MRKRLVKIIVKEREELKQSLKEHQETIYYNLILARLILKKRIGVKGIEADLGKTYLSYSIVNTIGSKYLRALRRPNKGRKYNSNGNNRTKRLALLGRYFSRQPKMQIQVAKTDTKIYNTVIPFTYKLKSNTLSSQHREL